ncbi:MAG: M1 family aminopeptidase [Acidobacteria bacterium]|nr:M1 family aminopeptidase [Acidobacteriota bacterium]
MKRIFFFIFAFLLFSFLNSAMDFTWSHNYQNESSKELVSLMNRMCSPSALSSTPTEGFKVERPAFVLQCSKGTLYFDNDDKNNFQQIFYEGSAQINFSLPDPIEQSRIERLLGKKSLDNIAISSLCIVPLGNSNDIPKKLAEGASASLNKDLLRFKTALRKNGIDILYSLLNKNLTDPLDIIILFEMKGDVWAYWFDSRSEAEVQLLRLAHPPSQDNFMWDEVAVIHRTKSGFLTPEITPEEYSQKYLYDVKNYEIDYSMDDTGRIISGIAKATISLKKPHSALLFSFFPDYSINSVTVNGEKAFFIKEDYSEKWGYYDSSLLVQFQTPIEGEAVVTFDISGTLFRPENGYLYLKDEDLWYPHLNDWDGATYKIKMTVPKENEIISIGESKSHTVNQDATEIFVWESNIPVKLATFTLGKFIHKIVEAEGLKLDIALPKGVRTNLLTQAQDYTLNELKNDILFYSKMFGPLPYPTLKVVITHYSHGRGFPTMLLLSESAFFRTGSTWPDQFMAHEVAHQWWGNLVDGLSYRDVWLSEGMAEFSSMLYILHFF